MSSISPLKQREAWRQTIAKVLLIGGILLAFIDASANLNRPLAVYTDAQFQLSEQTEIPRTFSEPVLLPDFWHTTSRFSQSPTGWYQINVPAKDDEAPFAVFLPKHTQVVDAYFNGEFIGSSGKVDANTGSMPINFNRPYLFNISNSLWQTGNNRIELRLTTMNNWGLLGPVVVGPSELLAKEYDARFFAQITVNQVASWVCALLALVASVYWYSDRRETQYLWFTYGCAAWGIVAANNYLTWFPVSVAAWSVLFHSCVEVFAVSMTFFIHRHLQLKRKTFEKILLAFVALAVSSYLVESLLIDKKINPLFHLATLTLGLYNIATTASAAIKQPTLRHVSLAVPIFIITILGIHDAFFSRGVIGDAWYIQFYSGLFATPLMLGFLLVVLSKDFVAALQIARNANLQLEDRVADISAQLEQSFEERRAAERRQAELQERERIYRDLHDDVGAKLLSLVYSANNDKQEQLARSAIDDIRSLMASQAHVNAVSDNYARLWQDECVERCQQADIKLMWQVPEELKLSAIHGYHLTRVLRELLTNALKHANCSKIIIGAETTDLGLVLWVEDNGQGLAPEDTNRSGSGIRGMRARLQKFAASLSYSQPGTGGTRATVSVPRNAETA